MYKRVSTAFQNPKVSILIRVATLTLLASLTWIKLKGFDTTASWFQLSMFVPLLLAALLSIVNLYAESEKYRNLFGTDKMDFADAFKSVLAGMSVGIWTPNRVGEFAGRLRYVPHGEKKRSIGATVIGSFLQGIVTLLFGCIGLWFSDFRFDIPFSLDPVLSIGAFLSISLVWLATRRYITRFRQKYFAIEAPQVIGASLYAIGRYIVFSTQFVLLLLAFGFSGTLVEAYTGVFLLYVVQSYIPGSFLSELGVREVLSVLFFASFFDHPIGAPLAAFSLWVFNIGLPIASWSFYSGVKKLET